jgi:hypothetical protein
MRLAPKPLLSKLIWITLVIIPAFLSQAAAVPAFSDGMRRELNELTPDYRESVLRGWRYFQTSYAKDEVACVHCHRDHEDMVPWARAYPKVQVFDGTPYKVKTLKMIVLEALEKHSDLGTNTRYSLADDLVAYIGWWGDGQFIHPGISEQLAPPAEDLIELQRAVARGRSLFNRRDPISCSRCHIADRINTATDKDRSRSFLAVDASFSTFPRSGTSEEGTVSLHTFLLNHSLNMDVKMDADALPDLAAFLAHLSRGRILRPGP